MLNYVGRFAPSPTGSLHFGSLFAAVVSFLHARSRQGKWLVRIEDIDPLREQPGASVDILSTLSAHGLYWDDEVVFQSRRHHIYEDVLDTLLTHNLRLPNNACFYCPCSRKQLNENQGLHSPACQSGQFDQAEAAIKFRANQLCYQWQDEYQGLQQHELIHDFVLKRKEGYYAYQLAVVCDDIAQNVSHVVRGYDLLDSTPMQLALYQALNIPPPKFAHFPVITSEGQKLSKQNLAPAISNAIAQKNLYSVLCLLGLTGVSPIMSVDALISHAIEHWSDTHLNAQHELKLKA